MICQSRDRQRAGPTKSLEIGQCRVAPVYRRRRTLETVERARVAARPAEDYIVTWSDDARRRTTNLIRNDQELIRACLGDDPAAWNELVERYGRLVYSIAMKVGLGSADADDVFQAVFGIVLRRLSTLRDHDRFAAWLIRLTYRESFGFRRRNRASAELTVEPAAGDVTDEEVASWERRAIVRQAMSEIDERCQKLLEALFYCTQEPSYEDIARDLRMPIGSIGPTRTRCFKKLETALKRLGI